MEKPLFILKPSILNALFPLFLKNLFFSSLISIILYFVYRLILYSGYNLPSIKQYFFIVLALILALLPLTFKIISLANTKYYFYHTHIISEFKLILIKKESVMYSKITNLSMEISLWDRFCRAGDIILHTSEDNIPDLKLKFIPHLKQVEKRIYFLINKKS